VVSEHFFSAGNEGTLQNDIRVVFNKFVVVETLQRGNKTQLGGWVRYIMVSELYLGSVQ
jgi:hypothetical protein